MSAIVAPAAEPLAFSHEEEEETGVRPYRWTVEAFYCAIRMGVLERPERLELINGEIIEMAAQETPHVQAVLHCSEELREVFRAVGHVRAQSPLDVSKTTEPEPDILVVRGTRRDFDDHKPTPADVLLLVEVSAATLGYDRNRKASIYAEAGVSEYWVLNLNARCLEVFREPAPLPENRYGFGYKVHIVVTADEAVSPLAAPQAAIRVNDLLPRVETGTESE